MHLIKKIISLKATAAILCLALAGLLPLLTTGCSTGKYIMNEKETVNLTPTGGEEKPWKKYVMKQKILSLGDKFIIKDETQNPVFYVKGKVFSFGNKLSFRDMSGKELAYISQRVFSFKHKYKIYRHNELLAQIVKKITLFKDKFNVDIQGPDDYKVAGNFWDHEYTFTRNGRKVASVSKTFFSWSDTYGIEMAPGEDDILILA
ncbi:MAG: LURP-one-related family protein, partial [Candidatus Aminicenantes bacterium]